jgi:hypothetical protein
MSIQLELTEKGWKDEILSSNLSQKTKDVLICAIRAVTNRRCLWPKVSNEEFDEIIHDQVIFVRLGQRGFILDKKGHERDQRLVLQEEKGG